MGSSVGKILEIGALGVGAYFAAPAIEGFMGASAGQGVLAAGIANAPIGTETATTMELAGLGAPVGQVASSAIAGNSDALALEAGSQLIGGVGKYESGKENAGIAEYNAQIAGQNATFAAQAGEQSAGNESLATRAQAGGALAQEGASGVQVGSSSFDDTQKSIRQTGELNALTIRSNAARQAYGFQSQVVGENAQAKIDTQGGEFGLAQGAVGGAGTTLLNAAGGNNYNAYLMNQAMGNNGG